MHTLNCSADLSHKVDTSMAKPANPGHLVICEGLGPRTFSLSDNSPCYKYVCPTVCWSTTLDPMRKGSVEETRWTGVQGSWVSFAVANLDGAGRTRNLMKSPRGRFGVGLAVECWLGHDMEINYSICNVL